MDQVFIESINDLALDLPHDLILIDFVFLHAILLNNLPEFGPQFIILLGPNLGLILFRVFPLIMRIQMLRSGK